MRKTYPAGRQRAGGSEGQFKQINAVKLMTESNLQQQMKYSHYEVTEVPSGTKILVKDVLCEWTFEVGTRIRIIAEFASGRFQGKIADLEFISNDVKSATGDWILVRNQELLGEYEPN